MDVSKNRGPPKSSILIRFSIINHILGCPYFWKHLGGGFKYLLYFTPIWEINHFYDFFFWNGWLNQQLGVWRNVVYPGNFRGKMFSHPEIAFGFKWAHFENPATKFMVSYCWSYFTWAMKKKLGCLRYLWVCTTQLYRDYNKPLKGSLLTNQDSMESNKGCFSWLTWFSGPHFVGKMLLTCSHRIFAETRIKNIELFSRCEGPQGFWQNGI